MNACFVALSLKPMNLHGKSRHHRANYREKINAVMNRLREKRRMFMFNRQSRFFKILPALA
jgi:hypothetical protein